MESLIAGRSATSLRTYLPSWGIWYVEASLSGEHELSGPLAVSCADLTLAGTWISGGPFNGRTSVRIVGGRGGWGKVLPAKPYHDDAGVRAAVVLRDAANEAGEEILEATLPSTRLGAHYTRPEGLASATLESLARESWYVGEDGVTRIGTRPTVAAPSGIAVSRLDRSRGVVELASTTIATVLPGVTFEGIHASDVLHEVTPEAGLRTTVWGTTAAGGRSRRLAGWRKLLEALDPDRRFRGVVEYRVVTLEGKRLNLQPVRTAAKVPSIRRVKAWPGVAGCDADVVLGSRVLVGWIDSDPSRPYVAAYEDAEGEGFVPTILRIADGTAFAAREGDEISVTLNIPTTPYAATVTGTITGGSSKVKIG